MQRDDWGLSSIANTAWERRNQRLGILLSSLLALTGCGLDKAEPPPPSKPPELSPNVAEAPPSARLPLPPPAKPAAPARIARAAPPTIAPQPQSQPEATEIERPPTEVQPVNPDRLMGLDQNQTQQLLGEPKQRSEAPPATIWRYVGRSCDLDIYFYLDLQSKVMRVLHYEVRNENPPEQRPERCVGDLVAQRQPAERAAADTDRAR